MRNTSRICPAVSAWYKQQDTRKAVTASLGIPPVPSAGQFVEWRQRYEEALVRQDLALVYPADTVARTFTGIAGMLNLLAIFDAVMLAALGWFGEPVRPAKTASPEKESAT